MTIQQANFPSSFDIHDPEVDYTARAKGMGVSGVRVTQPDEMAGAIRAIWTTTARS